MAERAARITSESVEEVSISVNVGRAFSPNFAISFTARTHFSISIEKSALSRNDSSFSAYGINKHYELLVWLIRFTCYSSLKSLIGAIISSFHRVGHKQHESYVFAPPPVQGT